MLEASEVLRALPLSNLYNLSSESAGKPIGGGRWEIELSCASPIDGLDWKCSADAASAAAGNASTTSTSTDHSALAHLTVCTPFGPSV